MSAETAWTAEMREAYERACAVVDDALLREITVEMVDIASPTGQERELAEHLVRRARGRGLEAEYQPLDELAGNALITYRGSGDGADLLLYAPIDAHADGTETDDLPWTGAELRTDMRVGATVTGDYVLGLGANNPKGHAACIIAAVEALRAADVPLRGHVRVGMGAGGMPVNAPVGDPRQDIGHGRGAGFMLDHGFRADFAVITKTNWAVSWEEVGLAWFRIRIHGAMNYTGVRHFVPYDNPILHVGTVVSELEEWFKAYATDNTSGLVAPQASIGSIQGGWTHKPTFSTAAVDLFLDLRLSPRTDQEDARHQVVEEVRRIGEAHGLRLSVEQLLSIPGTTTDPDSWIIRSSIRAWEEIEGSEHQPRRVQSGATDANVLRRNGLPTARIGLARVPDDAPVPNDFSKGMNVVSVTEMVKLTKHLLHVAIDTCARDRSEVIG
jgi:succinyl-diaminopimelate desuccinylase